MVTEDSKLPDLTYNENISVIILFFHVVYFGDSWILIRVCLRSRAERCKISKSSPRHIMNLDINDEIE